MRTRNEVSFRRRVVAGLEAMIGFLLAVRVVGKVWVALEHSAWQEPASFGAAVAVAGSIFLVDWLCVRWLHRKANSATRTTNL
jgi:hypothetical protein